MKSLNVAASSLAGLLIGLGVSSFNHSKANAEMTKQRAALQAALEQSEQARSKAIVQRDQSKDEADRLRQQSEEVHRLRAEVAGLKRDLAAGPVAPERVAPRVVNKVEPAGLVADKLKAKEGNVPLESAPLVIQAALLRELGSVPRQGFLGTSTDRNGSPTFAFKGQSDDGRTIALRLGADGSILEKSAEIRLETLPANIQAPVAEAFGNVMITGAREVSDGANVRYELSAKTPQAGMQVTVGGDGTILSYSARLQQPDKEQREPKIRK